MKPPAEIFTPAARSLLIRKNPDVASRTGVSPRAIRHAARDMSRRPEPPVAGAAARDVAAADDDVGRRDLHDREHARQQLGRMAEVGIDHADDRRAGRCEALDHRGAETELAGAVHDGDAIASREVVGERAGAIGRVVVDDDQLAVDAARQRSGEDRSTSSARRSRSL